MALQLQPGDDIRTGVLYRRIPSIPGYTTEEATGVRPSSHNFAPDTGEPYLSVELRDDEDPEGHIDKMLADHRAKPGSGLFEIDVEELVQRGLTVKYEPDEGERHFGVYGWEALVKPKDAHRLRRQLSFKARMKRSVTLPAQ